MPDPHDLTRSVSHGGGTPDPFAPTLSAADTAAPVGVGPLRAELPPAPEGRYVLGEEIARGGMGIVYRATDTAFGREVAVKVLQERYADTSVAARRFTDEARITGQLQHPAIPPAHDLGTFPGGRPFLAMKLIRGHTLDRLLTDRPEPSRDRGRFVAAFERVCQAVAYAHARHVIHRDLKPSNVMVGSFGEVQVMDWGLAKVMRSAERGSRNEEVDPVPTSHFAVPTSDETQAGHVVGTPAYMAPEQAAADGRPVDARSDVFGLGAVLAVVLTGQPPFVNASVEMTRILASQGMVHECFARLDRCGAEPELVALCKRCLAPEPDERPADAGEVAREVAELRQAADERARRAELDRATAEANAAAKRQRQRVMRVAAGVSVGLLVAGIVGTTVGLVRAERKAKDATNAAERERQAKTKESDARSAAETATATAKSNYRKALKSADALADELAAGVRPIAGTRRATVIAILDRARTQYDDLLTGPDPPPEAVAGKARLLLTLAELYRETNRSGTALETATAALALYDGLIERYPNDREHRLGRAACHVRIGEVLFDQSRTSDAGDSFAAAIGELDSLKAETGEGVRPKVLLADALVGAGRAHRVRGDVAAAGTAFRRGLAVARTAAKAAPDGPGVRASLAACLERAAGWEAEYGDREAGRSLVLEAVRANEAACAAHPDDADAHLLLAQSLVQRAVAAPDAAGRREAAARASGVVDHFLASDPGRVAWKDAAMQLRFIRVSEETRAATAFDDDLLRVRAPYLAMLSDVAADIRAKAGEDPDNFLWLGDAAIIAARAAEERLVLHRIADADGKHLAAAGEQVAAALDLCKRVLARDPASVPDEGQRIAVLRLAVQVAAARGEYPAAYAANWERLAAELTLARRLAAAYPAEPQYRAALLRSLAEFSGRLTVPGYRDAWPTVAKDAKAVDALVAACRCLPLPSDLPADKELRAAAKVMRSRAVELLDDVKARRTLTVAGAEQLRRLRVAE